MNEEQPFILRINFSSPTQYDLGGSNMARREQDQTTEQTAQEIVRAAKEAERGMQEAQQHLQEGTHQLAVMGERAFQTMMRSNGELMRRALEVNMELAEWSRDQLGETVSAARSLTQAKSVDDAVGAQARLMREAMENSMRHATKLFSLATQTMMQGVQVAASAEREVERAAASD